MNQEKLRRIHLIYGIILSVLIVILGICFIVSCVQIYLSGDRPFTRESVGAQLKAIIVPIILCVLGIVGGIVVSLFPVEEAKATASIDKSVLLKKLSAKCDFTNAPKELNEKIKKEQVLRRATLITCIFVNVIAVVIASIYLFNRENFPANDLNYEIAQAMIFVLPCTVVGLGAIFATTLISSSSIRRELELVKKVLRVSRKEGNEPEETIKNYSSALTVIRVALVVLAIVFIIIGISNGGMADVFEKANRMCTECIGLG